MKNRTGKGSLRARAVTLALAVVFGGSGVAVTSYAQGLPQKSTAIHNAGPGAYDVARETTVSGKVLEFSGASAGSALLVLQTATGSLNVHVGNPRLLKANHFTVQAGDEIKVTGENITLGDTTMFAARILQKGTQSLTVRSRNGMPIFPSTRTADGRIASPAGAR